MLIFLIFHSGYVRNDSELNPHIKKENSLITDIVYEFTNTRQQSIKDSLYSWDEITGKWKMNEYDNYYNHGIYRSGYTYQQQVMSSPLFFPVNRKDGISMGIQSNRFISHHLGVKGNFSEHLYWKGMLTYVKHLGTYGRPYEPSQEQLSGLFDIKYLNPEFPVDLGVAIAADSNSSNGKNMGFQVSIAKSW